jgi:hypothetical protein
MDQDVRLRRAKYDPGRFSSASTTLQRSSSPLDTLILSRHSVDPSLYHVGAVHTVVSAPRNSIKPFLCLVVHASPRNSSRN